MSDPRVEVDAVMAEVRERVSQKRAQGIYTDEVEALLRTPLPGGALFADEFANPLAALPAYLGTEVRYDPRSRRPVLGPAVTFARRALIWLLRWWVQALVERQERVNTLVLRALEDLAERPAPRLEARVARLEAEWKKRRKDEVAGQLEWIYFAALFSGTEPVIREQSLQFVPLFRGRRRVLDLGSGRGSFLLLMRDEGVGAYGVDTDAKMVELCVARGLEVHHSDGLDHVRALADGGIDGLFARHVAEHIQPGELVDLLRQCRRVLQPGSPVVMVTPNPRTITVGAHSFWLDPSHRRPIPPELFEFYLKVEGFVDVEVRTFAPTERRLSENVPEGPIRENVRLLNETLFGDRDYAVVGFNPNPAQPQGDASDRGGDGRGVEGPHPDR